MIQSLAFDNEFSRPLFPVLPLPTAALEGTVVFLNAATQSTVFAVFQPAERLDPWAEVTAEQREVQAVLRLLLTRTDAQCALVFAPPAVVNARLREAGHDVSVAQLSTHESLVHPELIAPEPLRALFERSAVEGFHVAAYLVDQSLVTSPTWRALLCELVQAHHPALGCVALNRLAFFVSEATLDDAHFDHAARRDPANIGLLLEPMTKYDKKLRGLLQRRLCAWADSASPENFEAGIIAMANGEKRAPVVEALWAALEAHFKTAHFQTHPTVTPLVAERFRALKPPKNRELHTALLARL